MPTHSFKRTMKYDLVSPERPIKRNNSPTRLSSSFSSCSSTEFKTPPHTPRRKRTHDEKHCLITSFKKSLETEPNLAYISPVSPNHLSSFSDEEESDKSGFSCFPIAQKAPYSFIPDSSFVSSDSLSEEVEPVNSLHHRIFDIPEILHLIITELDNSYTSYPCEQPPARRRPTSFNHALLICDNQQQEASKLWQETVLSKEDDEGIITVSKRENNIFNCLTVNKLWYSVTKNILTTKLFFSEESKWRHFVQQTSNLRDRAPTLQRSNSNTNLFILHKSKFVQQAELDHVAPHISGPSLNHLEFYICPQVLPPLNLFSSSSLTKLILPGSKNLTDPHLFQISKHCPQLSLLDLRQCPLISDRSIYYVCKNCQLLTSLNLSRISGSDLITDKSLYFITKYLRKIETLGLAGCLITDRGIIKVALYRSNTLKRLSLNSCPKLTNSSIPLLLYKGYLYNLVVLELRFNTLITDLKPLVDYQQKKWRIEGSKVLIECCEVLQRRFNLAWESFEQEKLKRLRLGLIQWISNKDDGDLKI